MENTNQTESSHRAVFRPILASEHFGQWCTFANCSQILRRIRVREESDRIAVVGLEEAVRGFIKMLGDSYCDREDSEVEPDYLDEEIACRTALFKSLQESPLIVSTNEESDNDDCDSPDEYGYRTILGECWGEVFESLHRYLLSMSQYFIHGYLFPIVRIIHKAPICVETPLAETDATPGWLSLRDYVDEYMYPDVQKRQAK